MKAKIVMEFFPQTLFDDLQKWTNVNFSNTETSGVF